MSKLSLHASSAFVKMILIGDPGSGKTGSLVSLVQAGLQLRIKDWDNGLDSLRQQILHRCPDKIDSVEYVTLRDKRVAGPDGPIVVNPTAFIRGTQLNDRWRYTDSAGFETDMGSPSGWGPDVVLVDDSFSFMSDAAYDWRVPLTPRGAGGKYDERAVYGDAQGALVDYLALVTSENFRTNYILTAHIRYLEMQDKTMRGYPNSIGRALSPVIGRYFNSIALCRVIGGGKRVIQTVSTAEIDLKNPNPFEMAKELPLETGLATFFETLRPKQEPKQTEPTKPIVTRLRRQ